MDSRTALLQAIVDALPSCRRCTRVLATTTLDDGDPYCDACVAILSEKHGSKLYGCDFVYAEEVRAFVRRFPQA